MAKKKDLTRVSVFLTVEQVKILDRLFEQYATNRSEAIRRAVEVGLRENDQK
jgi:metal-responsive CopG/Arc/MetJ family transcriptional regulator